MGTVTFELTCPQGSMGLDELRARLDSLLASQGLSSDRRGRAAALHDVLIELKVAAGQSRDALAKAERELVAERQHLGDAERRGRLAGEIQDAETARIAEEFAARHRERVELLARKVAVIRDEIDYTEREYRSVAAQYQSLRQGTGAMDQTPLPDVPDAELDLLKSRAEREAADAAVKAQLEHLKKKLGK